MRTPISYYGGKQTMLKHILPLIPPQNFSRTSFTRSFIFISYVYIKYSTYKIFIYYLFLFRVYVYLHYQRTTNAQI